MNNFILPEPRFATKLDVFGYKFIEKRLLYRINIIYVGHRTSHYGWLLKVFPLFSN